MLDPTHNLKKMRNQMASVKTRCLSFGTMERKGYYIMYTLGLCPIYLYILLSKKVQPLDIHLSSLIVADKQDPSMVGDVSCFYQVFLNSGFTATGMHPDVP